MAVKLLSRFFGVFKGLDLKRTHLTRELEYATDANNVTKTRSGDIVTVKGHKIWAQQFDSDASAISASERNKYPLYGLHTYVYTDTDTGEVKQELLGIGDGLYRLAQASMTIAYSGGGTAATFSMLPDGTDFDADLKVDGVSQSGFPLALGTGLADTPVTLATLRNAINAVSNFQCSLTPAAVVNGSQSSRSRTAAVTVHNSYSSTTQPHTFTVSTTEPTRAEFIRTISTTGRATYDIIAQTGTTLTPNTTSAFSVADLAEIGVGLYPAAILPTTNALSVKTSGTITFYYWQKVPTYDDQFPRIFIEAPSSPYLREYEGLAYSYNYTLKNNSNCVYIGMPYPLGDPVPTGVATPGGIAPSQYRTGIAKYDGHGLYAAGLPYLKASNFSTASATAGGSLTVGTYKYLARHKFYDKQENIIYSSDSYPSNVDDVISATTSGGDLQVALTITTPVTGGSYDFAPWIGYARVNGAQAGVNTINVQTGTAHTMRVGDWACFLSSTNLLKRKVTAITSSSITIDGAAVTVADNDDISAGNTIEIFRTKAGGQTYYKLIELPIDTTSDSVSYTDDIADASLGEEYDGPFTGNRRRDPPPTVSILENHQGLLVGAGDPYNPETLYWSNDDGPEYWPRGTNQTDISSTRVGPITALASDNIDMLAVFKDNSYFNVVGDLQFSAFSIASTHDGDVGCPSPHGWLKIRDGILFVSNKGPRVLRSGEIQFDDRLINLFLGNEYEQTVNTAISSGNYSKFVLRRTTAVHDAENQFAYFYLVAEQGDVGGTTYSLTLRPSTYGKWLLYDYANDEWYTRDTSDNEFQNMAGGGTYYKGGIYFLARGLPSGASRNRGFLYKQNNFGTAYDYADNSVKITPTYKPQWEFLQKPGLDKEALRIKVYCLPYSTAYDPAVTLRVKSYRNFNSSSVDTNGTLSLGNGVKEDELKLRSNKARAYQFEFTTDSFLDFMRISGYEVVYAAPYKEEDTKK